VAEEAPDAYRDVGAVVDAAHAVGALVWVDGVHYAAHAVEMDFGRGPMRWSVTYAADATLTVRFRRGTVYRYFTVPRAIFEAFRTAPSKGAYFTQRIRNTFPHVQLIEPPPQS
jgi:hypothetical protein